MPLREHVVGKGASVITTLITENVVLASEHRVGVRKYSTARGGLFHLARVGIISELDVASLLYTIERTSTRRSAARLSYLKVLTTSLPT